MGQFSWIFCNRKNPMIDNYATDTYLLIPEKFRDMYGGKAYITEHCYDGYGHMGHYDVYAEVAKWNKDYLKEIYERMGNGLPEKAKAFLDGTLTEDDDIREIGIDIACYNEDNCSLPYPIKIASKPLVYEDCYPSISDSNQGWDFKIDPDNRKTYEALKDGTYEPYNNRLLPYGEREIEEPER